VVVVDHGAALCGPVVEITVQQVLDGPPARRGPRGSRCGLVVEWIAVRPGSAARGPRGRVLVVECIAVRLCVEWITARAPGSERLFLVLSPVLLADFLFPVVYIYGQSLLGKGSVLVRDVA